MGDDTAPRKASEANHTDLDHYLSDLIRTTLGAEIASGDTSAPIIFPEREELAVRLVTQHSLDRLQDAESDRAVFDNLLWCLLGGIVGFFTNIVTGNQKIETTGYVLLACMAVAAVATLAMRRRLSRRLTDARRRVHHG